MRRWSSLQMPRPSPLSAAAAASGAPEYPEAVFAPRRMLSLAEAAGCISASSIAPYPPGVSVVAPGEEITREIVEYLAVVGYDVSAPVPVLDETGFVGKETL